MLVKPMPALQSSSVSHGRGPIIRRSRDDTLLRLLNGQHLFFYTSPAVRPDLIRSASPLYALAIIPCAGTSSWCCLFGTKRRRLQGYIRPLPLWASPIPIPLTGLRVPCTRTLKAESDPSIACSYCTIDEGLAGLCGQAPESVAMRLG